MEPSNLFDTWTTFARRLRGSNVCVLCDYDGTLVPAASGPGAARIPAETWKQLQRLSSLQRVTLGFLSGRSVSDLRGLVQIENAWYSGLYGHEIRNPQGLERRWYTRKEARRLAALADVLDRELASVPGVQVEREGGGLAVHYGPVDPERVRAVQDAVLRHWKASGPGLRFLPVSGHLEILPAEPRTKGTAVRFILGKIRKVVLPVYFGDDRTDLEAFRALRRSGIAIGVGDVSSPHLHYRVQDPAAVGLALHRIADVLRPGAERS
ncbi:MAG TPA: trehalose-phosphatase [Planctomycetota bacterium]|nr:trehalose-phosphatase [Planctomycetota bacterium]